MRVFFVLAASAVLALFFVPATQASLSPAHVSAADCFWCLTDEAPPPPTPPDDDWFQPMPLPPIDMPWPCELGIGCDGASVGTDGTGGFMPGGDGIGVTAPDLDWPNHNGTNNPGGDVPPPAQATYGCDYDYCDLAKRLAALAK